MPGCPHILARLKDLNPDLLAEHLGLRSRAELLAWIDQAGLRVLARTQAHPRHPKAGDVGDALHAARSKEVTSLWRLVGR